jgi:hypothetical protein
MHAVSEQHRQSSYAAGTRYVEQQAAAQRQAASSARSYSNRPLFGTNQGTAARRSSGSGYKYQIPSPLITSKDVARRAVHSSIRGGYGYRW